jgi:hypothetical protein
LRESVDSGFRCARGTVKAAPVILKSAPVVGTLKSAPVVGSIAPEPEVQGLTPSTTVSRAASAKGPPGNGADLVPPRLGSRGGWLQITNGTDHDAIVKLVAQADATKAVSPGSAVLHRAVYVSAHSSVKLERISPGQYRVLFCTGSGWDGGRNSFRTEYATRLFRRALLFSEQLTPEGARYTTYTLTLHGVPGGTAVADAFSKRTFDAIK